MRLIGLWLWGIFGSLPCFGIITTSAFFIASGKCAVEMIALINEVRMPMVFLGRFFRVRFVIWSGPGAFLLDSFVMRDLTVFALVQKGISVGIWFRMRLYVVVAVLTRVGSVGSFEENCSLRFSANILHLPSLDETGPFLPSSGACWFVVGTLRALVIFHRLPSSELSSSTREFHVFSLCILSSDFILLAR